MTKNELEKRGYTLIRAEITPQKNEILALKKQNEIYVTCSHGGSHFIEPLPVTDYLKSLTT